MYVLDDVRDFDVGELTSKIFSSGNILLSIVDVTFSASLQIKFFEVPARSYVYSIKFPPHAVRSVSE